jgi:hypothetical protein
VSLADARVEIIADLSTFRRDLREQMAEAAEYATRILNNKTATNTRTAKENLKSIPVAFKREMAVQTELARRNFDEKMTATSKGVREHYKTTAKHICDEFAKAADCAGRALESRLGRSAGKITDQYRVLNSVLDKALAGGQGQTGITDRLAGGAAPAAGGDDLAGVSAAQQRRVVAALQRQLASVAGAADTGAGRASVDAGREAEKAALSARKAFRDMALNAADESQKAARAAEDALRRVAAGGGNAAKAAASQAAAAAQEAAGAARKAADDAMRGSGEIADSTARAANRAADAAERAAARAGRAASNALERSFSDSGGLASRLSNRLKRTFGLLESESQRAGRTNGQTFLTGLQYSFTAGIGITFGMMAAKAALLTPFLSPIASVLSAAAGAATALASALGTGVVGAAVAAAAAVGGILAAVVTVRVGFGGIVDALKQKQLSDKAGISAASQTGVSSRSSDRQVDNATQAVASSQVAYARSLRESKDATRDAKIARDALTDAYVQAKRALEDYDLAVQQTAYDELDATAKAKKAHEALRQAYSKRGATGQELSDAQLAADKADLDITQAKLKQQRAIEDKSTADAKGVSGSDQVVAALKAVEEADQRVADAQQSIKDAALAVTNAVRDRNDAIADSAEKAAGSVASATKVLDDQIKQLAPNARAVYYALDRIYESYKLVKRATQQRLFAGTATDLDALSAIYLPKTQTGLGLVADSLNRAMRRAAEFGKTAETKARIDRIFAGNAAAVDAFLQGTKPLLHIVLVLADAIAPFGKRFGQYLARLLEIGDASLTAAEKSGALSRFLETAWDDFQRLMRIIGLFGKGLLNVLGLGNDTGQDFLRSIEKVATVFLDFTEKDEGRKKIIGWFADAKAAASEFWGLLKDIGGIFGDLAGETDAAGFIKDVRELVAALGEFIQQMSGGDTSGSILDTITGFINTLNKANAGDALHEFIDTVGDIASTFATIVHWGLELADKVPGGTAAIHGLAVALGTLAAFKFVSMTIGLGGGLKTLGSIYDKAKKLKGVLGGKAASKVARAAEECVEDAIDPCADLDDLAGGVPGKGKKAGTRAERKAARKEARAASKGSKILATEAEKTARAGSKSGALKNVAAELVGFVPDVVKKGFSAGKSVAGAIASGARSAGGVVAKAGTGLVGALTGAVKGSLGKVKAVAVDAAKAMFPSDDSGFLDLGAKSRKTTRAARSAAKAGKAASTVGAVASAADVGADVAKGGKVAAIGKAAKDAVGSVAALTGVMAANTGAALANGAAWAKNAISIVATKVAMLATRAATVAYTAVQWLLNAAMYANPIGLVVLAVVALVAIFVIAYKKSETFRNIINALGRALLGIGEAIWTGLKAAFGYVTRFYKMMFDFWTGLPGKIVGWITGGLEKIREIGHLIITKFLEGLAALGNAELSFGKKLANGLISALNGVLDFLNKGLAKIPKALTFGVKLKIPPIPALAQGAIVRRETLAIVGEAGPEVVIPLTRPARARELAEQSGLVAMLQLKELLPTPPAPRPPAPAPVPPAPQPVDRSVHVENLHVHHNGQDTARATEKALRRVARLAMS